MFHCGDIVQSATDAQEHGRNGHAQADREFRRDITPDGRMVGEVSVPDDRVDEVNERSEEGPSDVHQSTDIPGTPVPRKRQHDEDKRYWSKNLI